MPITVVLLNETNPEFVGLILQLLDASDPRPAAEQFDERYAHGGGWRPMPGFKLTKHGRLKYPGDPEMEPRAVILLRDEMITIFDHAWVMITQREGGFQVARMD
jgi:hypothetical protein